MRGAVICGQRDVRFKERAMPITAMTHIAMVETTRRQTADWVEKVSDEQYQVILSGEIRRS